MTVTSISVVGCGYLGATHAACMAELGHEVVGIDVDVDTGRDARRRRAPFYEPGLDELLRRGLASGRLRFTTDYAEAAARRDVHFVVRRYAAARGELRRRHRRTSTPPSTPARTAPDPSGALVVGKSTVPVGTAPRLAEPAAPTDRAGTVELAWNPEFLREGHAVEDTLHPDRLVFGVAGDRAAAPAAARSTPLLESPAFRRGRHRLRDRRAGQGRRERVPRDQDLVHQRDGRGLRGHRRPTSSQLADAIGHDDRIGRNFLSAGLGFGGGCLPKDIRAFMARAGELGAEQALTFLREVDDINLRRRVAPGRPRPRRARRLARRTPGRRARRGLQARQRRHPRLTGPQRRGAAPACRAPTSS